MKTFSEWVNEAILSRGPMKFPDPKIKDSLWSKLFHKEEKPVSKPRPVGTPSGKMPIVEFNPRTRTLKFTDDGITKEAPTWARMKGPIVRRNETGQLYRVRWV